MTRPAGLPSVGGIIGRVVVLGVITSGLWVIGLDVANSLTIALIVLTFFSLRALVSGEPETWEPEPETSRTSGTRREVARLSWGLHGQGDRVDRWSASRLRKLAARRVAVHGLDLDHPEDEAECRRLLGSATFDAVRLNPNRLPPYRDFVAALDSVERLARQENSR
jgi:hypothetical protein